MRGTLQTTAFSLVVLAGLSAQAQQPTQQAQSAGVLVAVIDIGYIFENYVGFNQKLEAVKAEVKAYEGEMQQQRKTIIGQRDQLQQFKSGTMEYRRLEEEIARRISDAQVRSELKKKEVLEREAQLYFDTYNDIVKEVGTFADRHGISLVLRFDSREINPEDQRAVLHGVNRAVVYQQNLNITKPILDRLNANAVSGRPAQPPR